MIDVTRIDHISMAVRELEPQIELLERLFGFRYRGRFSQAGYVGADLEVPGRSGIGWEVLAPDGPGSYLHRFLDGEHGPGLHHVAMQVRDMDSALVTMQTLGVEPWGYEARNEHEEEDPEALSYGRDNQPAGSVAYIHPRSGGAGALFQLYDGPPWHLPEPFEDERSDTLGITAVSGLAHAHYSRQELADWYEQLLGFRTVHHPAATLTATSFSSLTLEAPGSQIRMEVMQPRREDSFLQRFLDQRGPAMHHVSFEVRDLQHAVFAAERSGVRVIGERSGSSEGSNWNEAFLAPEDTGGMLVQIFAWEPVDPPRPTSLAEPVGDEPG